ncbi:MAG TPA: TIGR04222 domain-containing membrane protein [Pseudonocardia sp.]|jgi:uncharacterized protein (TIGR04222 family)|nr:TIGR04222 domain-containing membrane protein [Pseudonocardia sp.]
MSSVILAQGGDSWGISGPAFLVGYLIVGGALAIAALRTRRAMSAVDTGTRGRRGREFTARFVPRASSAATEADAATHVEARAAALSGPTPASGASAAAAADPYLIALLNGGPKLAVLAGQSALRAHGLLGEGPRVPEAAARAIPAARPKWPLELAILSATDLPVPYSRLQSDPAVVGALRALLDELVQHRLLVSEQRRDRLRLWGLALFGLFALGVWRLVDGIGNGHPVGFLVPPMLLAGAGTALWYLRLPRRTPSGDAALARLRREYAYLVPSMCPGWAASGPAAAALGVAVFGVAAIWAADPAFAAELEIAGAAATAHALLASDSSGSAGRTYWGGSPDSG